MRILEKNPKNDTALLEYANFLAFYEKNHNLVRKYYNDFIKRNPDNSSALNSYAIFEDKKGGNHENAEKFYLKAIANDPENTNILTNYAYFLEHTIKDYKKAGMIYYKAHKIEPANEFFIEKVTELELAKGCYKSGKKWLRYWVSFINRNSEREEMEDSKLLKSSFYKLAHFSLDYPNAQTKIVELLKQGIRYDDWNFSRHIEQAKKQNHPNIPLLQALANVISNKAEFDTLKPFLQETETATTK